MHIVCERQEFNHLHRYALVGRDAEGDGPVLRQLIWFPPALVHVDETCIRTRQSSQHLGRVVALNSATLTAVGDIRHLVLPLGVTAGKLRGRKGRNLDTLSLSQSKVCRYVMWSASVPLVAA
eukprot:1188291-Rhodomonas_salina.3